MLTSVASCTSFQGRNWCALPSPPWLWVKTEFSSFPLFLWIISAVKQRKKYVHLHFFSNVTIISVYVCISVCVCMWECLCVSCVYHTCNSMHIPWCVCNWQTATLWSLSPASIFSHALVFQPQLSDLCDLCIHEYTLHPQSWEDRHTPLFIWLLGTEFRSSCLKGKLCNLPISPDTV